MRFTLKRNTANLLGALLVTILGTKFGVLTPPVNLFVFIGVYTSLNIMDIALFMEKQP